MPAPTTDPRAAPPAGERLAKAIARAGLCSRRQAEDWIRLGRVSVDGTVVNTPAFNVDERAVVAVDGTVLPPPPRARLWRYHKPPGLVTTHRDPENRPTVFQRLPAELGRVISVGRLDLTSEGLLLLTNSGALARHLELPSTGWTRRYRVRAFGTIEQAALNRLRAGIRLNGVDYGPIEAELELVKGSNVWMTLALREGKNREIRIVLDHLGLTVNRLIRMAFGPFQLGNLARGEVAPVPPKALKEQLGRSITL
jgi:23S rRNA pseudouridine2605 synthase